jgi:hypothetical protein
MGLKNLLFFMGQAGPRTAGKVANAVLIQDNFDFFGSYLGNNALN